MINYRDYPGTISTPKSRKELTRLAEKTLFKVKKAPSLAQIKQRHRFMLMGTFAGMDSRLEQILRDVMITSHVFRRGVYKARREINALQFYLKHTDVLR